MHQTTQSSSKKISKKTLSITNTTVEMKKKMTSSSRSNRTLSFFKIMTGDFMNQLGIPPLFVKRLGRLQTSFPQKILLRKSSGRCWSVKLNKSDNHIYLQYGWKKFAEDNSLERGDFLVFDYHGYQEFHVCVYGKNCCEKGVGIRQGRRERDETRVDVPEVVELDHEETSKEVDDESEETDEVASEEFLECVRCLRQSYVRNCKMLVPKIFRRFVKINETVKLQSANGTGTAKVRKCHSNYIFGSGWVKFERANNFKPGDMLNFRLIDTKDVTIEVSLLDM